MKSHVVIPSTNFAANFSIFSPFISILFLVDSLKYSLYLNFISPLSCLVKMKTIYGLNMNITTPTLIRGIKLKYSAIKKLTPVVTHEITISWLKILV